MQSTHDVPRPYPTTPLGLGWLRSGVRRLWSSMPTSITPRTAAGARPRGGRSSGLWVGLCVAILLSLVGHVTWTLTYLGPPRGWASTLALVVPLYFLGQGLRALRLFLLTYDRRIHFGDLALVQVMSAAACQLIPFKLGELLRIGLVGKLQHDPTRALLAVWAERIYDITACTLILTLPLTFGDSPPAHPVFLALAATFLFMSFFLFLVLPENLSRLKRYLLLRHADRRSLRLLQLVDQLHVVLRQAGDIWRSHWATVTWLTIAIWGIELSWISVLVWHIVPSPGAHPLLNAFATIILDPWLNLADGPISSHLRFVVVDCLAIIGAASALVIIRRRALTTRRAAAPETRTWTP